MATEVYLHIGPPKSGSTFLQAILWANRASLAGQGLLVPGPHKVSQFHAVVDLLDRDPTGVNARAAGAYAALIARINQWPDRVVVSHENLGFATRQHVERMCEDLRPARLHIIFTPRALDAVVAASWQERIKSRSEQSWSEFIEEIRESRDNTSHPFWRQHRAMALRDWSTGADPLDVHVVTVPRGESPEQLWDRFARALGIDPSVVVASAPRSNESLGVQETIFLRDFNRETASSLDWDTYRSGVKHGLAGVLAAAPGKTAIKVPSAESSWLADQARDIVAGIEETDYQLVGHLGDLLPEQGLTEQDNDAVDPAAQQQLSRFVLLGLVRLLADAKSERRQASIQEQKAARALQALEAELETTTQRLRQTQEELQASNSLVTAPLLRVATHRLAVRFRVVHALRESLRRRRSRRDVGPG